MRSEASYKVLSGTTMNSPAIFSKTRLNTLENGGISAGVTFYGGIFRGFSLETGPPTLPVVVASDEAQI